MLEAKASICYKEGYTCVVSWISIFEYMHVLVVDWHVLFQKGPSEDRHFLLQSTICPDRSRSSMHIAVKQSFWETPSMEQCGISWTK